MINSLKLFDAKIIDYINKYLKNSFLDKAMPLITLLGNLGFVWIISSIFLLKSRIYRKDGIMLLGALILTTIVGEGIMKHLIRRTRPFEGKGKEELLISEPITYSFPSGHAASSFAAAGIFIMTNNPISMYITLLATLIAFSRLYLNVHYPTDILSGIILGIICSNIIVCVF